MYCYRVTNFAQDKNYYIVGKDKKSAKRKAEQFISQQPEEDYYYIIPEGQTGGDGK